MQLTKKKTQKFKDIWATVDAYLQYGTVTTISSYQDSLQTFPAITICNINPFDSGNPTTYAYMTAQLNASHLSTSITPGSGQYSIYLVRQAMDVIKSSAIANFSSNPSYVYDLGFSINYLLISCYFNGFTCNASDFYQYYSYEYGNCYIFNHDYGNGTSLKKVSKTGPRSGLQLELYTGYPGKVPIALYNIMYII